MTARQLRLLADCLEREFVTAEDRKAWITSLRGDAKSLEWRMQELEEEEQRT